MCVCFVYVLQAFEALRWDTEMCVCVWFVYVLQAFEALRWDTEMCVCVVCAGFSCLGRGRGVCVHIVLNVYVRVSALHMNVCVC